MRLKYCNYTKGCCCSIPDQGIFSGSRLALTEITESEILESEIIEGEITESEIIKGETLNECEISQCDLLRFDFQDLMVQSRSSTLRSV